MADRALLHIDLNNFFASVEQIRDTSLKGKAIAVCGNAEERKGIVLAKSEEAKKFNVKTGDTIWLAQQKCPHIIIVQPKHDEYGKYSKLAQEIYYRFTDLIESFGIDECWLDVTPSRRLLGTGEEIAEKIRVTMKEELGLTVSIGVSWNKTFAKIGSDLKKPDAITVITRENYRDVIHPLPVSSMLFVGRKTVQLFEKLNIKTIGDLANFDPKLLAGFMGIMAHKLVKAARGDCDDQVTLYGHKEQVKSVGNGGTAKTDLTTMREVRHHTFPLVEKLTRRMRQKNVKGTTISASIRYFDLKWEGAQRSIHRPTSSAKTVFEEALKVIEEIWDKQKPIRAIRVAVCNLTGCEVMQMDVNDMEEDKISDIKDDIIIHEEDDDLNILDGSD